MAFDDFLRRRPLQLSARLFAAILSFFKPYPRKERGGGGLKSPFRFLGEIKFNLMAIARATARDTRRFVPRSRWDWCLWLSNDMCLLFIFCRHFFKQNYEELKKLNPDFSILMRTTENAMPAVTTEIDFTEGDVIKYMLQTGKFKNTDGTLSQERIQAAKDYLKTDWTAMENARWNVPGFDPERPFLGTEWRDDPSKKQALSDFIKLKDEASTLFEIVQSGPNQEYKRAYNSLLMHQRVDLWCAGPKEVEAAVRHLVMLGQRFNKREPDYPEFITEFYPGVEDL